MTAQPQRRYKSKAEWEAMRQANPDLDERFVDSPIISSRPLGGYAENEGAMVNDARTYRQRKTTESLTRRKLLAQAKLNANNSSPKAGLAAYANNNPYLNNPIYKAGLSTGRGLGKLKRKFSIPGNIARYVTLGSWATLQFPLIMYGFIFIALGGMGVGATTPITKLLSELGVDINSIITAFMAPGFAILTTATIIALLTIFGVLIIFWVTGTRCLGGDKLSGKWVRFLAILILSLVPILPWPIWWINYVATNPD